MSVEVRMGRRAGDGGVVWSQRSGVRFLRGSPSFLFAFYFDPARLLTRNARGEFIQCCLEYN